MSARRDAVKARRIEQFFKPDRDKSRICFQALPEGRDGRRSTYHLHQHGRSVIESDKSLQAQDPRWQSFEERLQGC